MVKRNGPPIIILYGHKFNGNLWALYNQKLKNDSKYITFYLSMDKKYVEELNGEGIKSLWTGSLSDLLIVAKSRMIITDHHPQLNFIFFVNPFIHFIDVWHGIPYKGYSEKHFDFLKKYGQIWTNSKFMADFYINKCKFRQDMIKITGYGRTDCLINGSLNKPDILKKYKLENYSNYVLIATTWKQDDKNRLTTLFGMEPGILYPLLNEFGINNDILFIIRSHLNDDNDYYKSTNNIKFMPYQKYPIAEEFLYLADALITDWSSIAFDYLVTKRPTIFLDVKAPFSEGFTYSSEFRYGPIVKSVDELFTNLKKYLNNKELFTSDYFSKILKTREFVYSGTDDGQSLNRYMSYIDEILD
jgi:CDP-glycerol glycerophosphotransferase